MLFSHLSLQCLYESGLVYNDSFVLNVDWECSAYGEIEPISLSGQYVSGEDHTFQELFECPTWSSEAKDECFYSFVTFMNST